MVLEFENVCLSISIRNETFLEPQVFITRFYAVMIAGIGVEQWTRSRYAFQALCRALWSK